MLKAIALFALFLFSSVFVTAQNHSDIKGHVVDSLTNNALEFSTVAVLDAKDSSLVSYTVTTKTGDFVLHNLPAEKPLRLIITFISYQTYRKKITLLKGVTRDFGTIKMGTKNGMMSEININAEAAPITVKKDTIEFSAEAFKTPPNAVVEELLKRLPGVQVDIDGTITVNGKKVNKLLIDGKEFFANDPKIASKNLDANLISKIQVYDDRENDPDHLIPDSKVDKIINLKFKSALKKSTFGKVRAGYGTQDRFDGGLLYNMFRDTLQISLIGIGNNLNKTGFSNQDLISQGGFNRSGSDVLYGNTGIATGGRSYGGIQTVGSGGVNINTDYGKKLKLNLLYFYSYTRDEYNSSVFRQQFFHDTTLTTNSTSNSQNNNGRHNISGLVEWKPDTIVKIRYTPQLNFSDGTSYSNNGNNSFNNFTPRLNSSENGRNGTSDGVQFQQSFSYYRKLHKKGSSLNITHNLNINPRNSLSFSDQDFISYTTALSSSNLHRLGDNFNNSTTASIGITYRYPFTKKITGNISFNGNYNFNRGRLFTYNQNLQTGQYNLYIDSLSRDLRRDQFTETIRPELNIKLSKTVSVDVNTGIQWMQTYNQFNKNIPDINRYDIYLLPSLRFNADGFSFSYDASVRQPGINDLLPLTTFYSQLYSTVGNPDLKPTRSHSFSFNYYKYNNEKQLNTNLYTGFNLDENSVFSRETINSQGATIAKPINRNGYYSGYMGMNVGKGFKKIGNWQIRLNGRISGSYSQNFIKVNALEGYQNSSYFTFNQQFFINWNNKFELSPSYNINPTITTYRGVPYDKLSYITQSIDLPVVLRWIKHTTIEANYNYRYNPLVGAGYPTSSNILNIAIARQIQKRDRGEIRLSCYDLFDQNINVNRYASGNAITETQSQIVKRYFLLSYAYRFSNTVTAKKK